MPMISQLPVAATVTAADEVPISQDGSVCSVSVGVLLASTQPSIIIPHASLLGRASVGAGAPEGIEIGAGIELTNGTIVANGADHAGFPFASGLLVDADLVVSEQGNQMLMPASSLRGLFSAGQNIAIDANGVISSSASGGVADGGSASFSINNLQPASAVIAADTIPICQNGTAYAVTYSNFIDGLTIDHAPAAAPASDTDTVWVAQGSNAMGAQTLGAIWTWIANGLPRYRPQVTEIVSSTTLSYANHNGRMLVVTTANVMITPNFSAMGSGFYCDIITNGVGSVVWGAGIVTTNGAASLPANSYARLLACTCSTGNIVMACVGPTAGSGGTSVAAPGLITTLASTATTSGSLAFTWSPPTTGGTATSYVVQYRVSGASTWTPVNANPVSPSVTLTGLSPATFYDVEVAASNSGGTGSYVQLSGIATSTTLTVPGSPSALTTGTVTSSSVFLTWMAPGSGGTPTGYAVEYSLDGGSTWSQPVSFGSVASGTVVGLSAATTYAFRVAATNAAGTSTYAPASSYPTAATAAATTTPGLPTALTFTAVSSTGMTVQWTAPSGTVTGYNLQYRVLNTTIWAAISSATTSAMISGLTPSTTYEFQVQAVNGASTSSYTASATNATAATNTDIYKLTPAPTRQSPTMGWAGTTIVMANGQPGFGYNAGDNSAASDGSHPVPAAVGFAWSSSNTIVPAVTNAGSSGLALDGHNLWYTWAVTYPSVPGNYYLWAIAKDSSGNVGGTCVSPTPFTLQ